MSLVADNVSFSYQDGHEILKDFSLSVDPNERVALQAPSGTGKTTLCQLLAGYLRPQAGEVLVDGAPVLNRRGLLRRVPAGPRPVQLIRQHPEQAFDPLVRLGRSVTEGLLFSDGTTQAKRGRNDRALEQLRASGLLERFGVREAWFGRFPHELSGGELMRLCLVRALLAQPRYLVCDEMTAMLDAVTQAALWREVLEIADRRAMGLVIVSHSPALVRRLATRIAPLA